MMNLGAAIAAAIGVGHFNSLDEVKALGVEQASFQPSMPREQSDREYKQWLKAIECCLHMAKLQEED